MGDAATRDAASPEQLAAMVQLLHEALVAGALGFSSSLGEGHIDGDGRPVPSRSASFEEFVALAGALRDHPGTTLEFIPTVGPIPDERMELMADMSLAADRAAQLEPARQPGLRGDLRAAARRRPTSPPARGAHVVALTLPDMMRMRASTLLARCPVGATSSRLDHDGRRAAVADPATRAAACGPAPNAARPGVGRALGLRTHGGRRTGESSGEPWVGRASPTIAAARGTDVIDVLIDVVLVDRLTLFVVLPSLTPSLGRSDEGWRVRRVEVWKDPRVMLGGSDAGAHVDLMCHANYPDRRAR